MRLDISQQKIYACIEQEFHLVKVLKANILMKNNIIVGDEIFININTSLAFIASCTVSISIHVWQRDYQVNTKYY